MTDTDLGRARAVADTSDGLVLASVDLPAAPEAVFDALTGEAAIRDWWVRPGVFDTREWRGDLRPGGRWRSSGIAVGRPYAIEGEFLEVSAPHRLVHTWLGVGAPGEPNVVSYRVEAVEGGSRLTLRHAGIADPNVCRNTAIAWETSFARLRERMSA